MDGIVDDFPAVSIPNPEDVFVIVNVVKLVELVFKAAIIVLGALGIWRKAHWEGILIYLVLYLFLP